MKQIRVVMVLLALAAVGVFGYRAVDAEQNSSDGHFRMALVNVAKVMQQCQEKLDRDELMRKRAEKFTARLEQLRAEAQALRNELEQAVQPNTAEFRRLRQEWTDKAALYESYQKGQREIISLETQQWAANLYDHVLEEVAKVARQERISLVLNLDDIEVQQRDMEMIILGRKVIYNTPGLDITARVLQQLDAVYLASSGK